MIGSAQAGSVRRRGLRRVRCLWGILLVSGLVAPVGGMTLSANGVGKACIVTAGDKDPAVGHAAQELAVFLSKVTGGTFAVTDRMTKGQAAILVGPAAARLVDPAFSIADLGEDGIVVRTQGGHLILAGGKPRGTLYAVYSFLEDVVGCRWWTPTVSTVPRKPTLTIGPLDIRYVPCFEHRDVNFIEAFDGDWSVRNKANGPMNGANLNYWSQKGVRYIAQPPEHGGNHTFGRYLCGHDFLFPLVPPSAYFKDHPEWYSLINGKRTAEPSIHASLCLTNPEMKKELVKNMKAELRAWPDSLYAWLSPPDDDGYPCRCQCDNCVAVEKQEGSPSGLVLRFVNSVADEIAKEFPQVNVGTYAYHYTRKPPESVKPRPKMMVYLCAIECSFSKPFSDERNRLFLEDLRGWSRICNRVYIWNYAVNFDNPLIPHPNWWVMLDNYKLYVDHGVKGIMEEGDIGEPRMEMSELRMWVTAKKMWDPRRDGNQLIEEFVNGFYGPAGPAILAYMKVMHEAVQASGDWLGLGSPVTAKFLNIVTLSRGLQHLQAAQAAVRDRPELRARVEAVQLPVLFVFLMRWQELRDAAACRGIAWPLPNTIGEAHQRFAAIVEGNRITLTPKVKDDVVKALGAVGPAPAGGKNGG